VLLAAVAMVFEKPGADFVSVQQEEVVKFENGFGPVIAEETGREGATWVVGNEWTSPST
jgi:hypothetical protein